MSAVAFSVAGAVVPAAGGLAVPEGALVLEANPFHSLYAPSEVTQPTHERRWHAAARRNPATLGAAFR